MTRAIRFILGDQLSPEISSLDDADPDRDVIFLCEVRAETTYVPHHPKKIVFLFSAMRHFAAEMREGGWNVDYVAFDAAGNTGSFRGEIARAVGRHAAERVVVTFPGEWRVLDDMRGWEAELGVPVEIREDTRFLCSRAEFARHAESRQGLRMEFFYREMRLRHGILIEPGDRPTGGAWNFDKANRKALPGKLPTPGRLTFEPDAITREVMALVGGWNHYYGSVEGFDYGVTAADARAALQHFLTHALPSFGDYQDAMRGEEELFHSVLSPYLNVGLLDPTTVCRAVEFQFRDGRAPLNSAEGYIRQILGWREYIHGVYWLRMPEYAASNWLNSTRKLPELYWNGRTDMNCMARTVGQTVRTAHAHHIQRLMVAGNFALIAGITPAQVEAWYLAVYIDAYEWVELPNVHGMVLYADGGMMSSKPYAASGKYIDRMSDYCGGCRYDVRQITGPDACPFNFLYWNFLIEHRGTLADNPRMRMMYVALARMSPTRQAEIAEQSRVFLDRLERDGTDEQPFALG